MTEKKGFPFKKNKNVNVLKEQKEIDENKDQKKQAVGRPRKQAEVRKKHIGCYLTEEESLQLQSKLDGRPASSVVRSLILDYINN